MGFIGGKMKIDFIGIGFHRCGTTFLCEVINKHPKIWVHPDKEVCYFNDGNGVCKFDYSKYGLKGYEYLFSIAPKEKVVGEFSPGYIMDRNVMETLHKHFPKVKFIIMTRDKHERALSLLYVKIAKFREYNYSVKDAKEESDYEKYINNVSDILEKHEVLFLTMEEMRDNPDIFFKKVYDFLGVKNRKIKYSNLIKEKNEGNKKTEEGLKSFIIVNCSIFLKHLRMHPIYFKSYWKNKLKEK